MGDLKEHDYILLWEDNNRVFTMCGKRIILHHLFFLKNHNKQFFLLLLSAHVHLLTEIENTHRCVTTVVQLQEFSLQLCLDMSLVSRNTEKCFQSMQTLVHTKFKIKQVKIEFASNNTKNSCHNECFIHVYSSRVKFAQSLNCYDHIFIFTFG